MPKRSSTESNGTETKKKVEPGSLERYEIIEIERSAIQNAPYNPRTISDKAKAALKDNLVRVGLLSPITWNVRTGNIVSGHQRIAAMDSLYRTKDYKLRVAKVELDDKTEKEQNIFMNNPEAMGGFDIEKLGNTLKEVDVANTGFDLGDVFHIFGSKESAIDEMPNIEEFAEQVSKARESFDKIVAGSKKRDEINFYVVAVFASDMDRNDFLTSCGLPMSKFVDGRLLRKLLYEGPRTTPYGYE